MNFNTEGFLLMSDDVLLKYWHLKKLDLKKIWNFMPLVCERELNLTANLERCQSQHIHMCTIAVYNAIEYLESIRNGSIKADKEEKAMVFTFLETLDKHADLKSNFRKFTFQSADIFYLPKSKLKAFHYFSRVFVRFNVVLEIAVPTILAALDTENSYEVISGKYNLNFGSYSQINFFLHPSKISHYKNPAIGYQYCSLYVQEKIKSEFF
jgi:hypothetical protein